MGDKRSGTYPVTTELLRFAHVELETSQLRFEAFDDAAALLQEGELDAAFFLVGIGSQAINGLLQDDKVELVPIQIPVDDQGGQMVAPASFIQGFQVHYPFAAFAEIPMMAYSGRPSRPVPSLAISAVLVCRDDLG